MHTALQRVRACCLWLVDDITSSMMQYLNLNFSILNWIPLLLISSSYPVVLTSLGGPHNLEYSQESNLVPLECAKQCLKYAISNI